MPKYLVKSGSLKVNNTLYLEGSTVELTAVIAEQALAEKTLVPVAKGSEQELPAKKEKKG